MKLFYYSLILLIFSCSDKKNNAYYISEASIDSLAKILKEDHIIENQKELSFKNIITESDYKYSSLKKMYDSIKINDSASYIALNKIIEQDTVDNYYNDYFFYYSEYTTEIQSDDYYKMVAYKKLKKNKYEN